MTKSVGSGTAGSATPGGPGMDDVPIWLWPTILSLDAPAVAIVWLALLAVTFGVQLRVWVAVALGLTVWLVYAVDRLLDGLAASSPGETPRHRFYRRHRRAIIPCVIAVGISTAGLALSCINPVISRNGIVLGGLVSGYFVVTHACGERFRRHWPKELMVAILFAAGTCLPVWSLLATHRSGLFVPYLLLVAVFWVNTLGIECWETTWTSRADMNPWISRLMATHLGSAAILVALSASLRTLLRLMRGQDASLGLAVTLSAAALAFLEANHRRMSRASVRVLADTVLLTPALFLSGVWF